MLPISTRPSSSSNSNNYKGDKIKLSNNSRKSNNNNLILNFINLIINVRNRFRIFLIIILISLVLFLHSSIQLPLKVSILRTSITNLNNKPKLAELNKLSNDENVKELLLGSEPIEVVDVVVEEEEEEAVVVPVKVKVIEKKKEEEDIIEEIDSLSWPKEWNHLLLKSIPSKNEDYSNSKWIGIELLKESIFKLNLNTGLLKEESELITKKPPFKYFKQSIEFMRIENLENPNVSKLDGRIKLLQHDEIFLNLKGDGKSLLQNDETIIKMSKVSKGLGGVKPLKKIQLENNLFDKTLDKIKEEKERREWVRRAFVHTWTGYKTYAWGHDELSPISHGFSDHFNGWAATIIDTLDTLIIMDLPEQYNLCREHISQLDFTYLLPTSPNAFKTELPKLEIWNPITRKSMHLVHTYTSPTTIPTFETIIRYLGGLISAFDLTNDSLMLIRAIELGNWILPSLDTIDGLAKSRYKLGENLRGGYPGLTSLAEVGTLSLEFTRLSQLTGDEIYFQAVKRTMSTLDTKFPDADLPPTSQELLDTEELKLELKLRQEARRAGLAIPPIDLLPILENKDVEGDSPEVLAEKKERREVAIIERERKFKLHEVKRRKTGRLGKLLPSHVDPGAQNMAGVYSFGGESDSHYEYLIKMYQLIGDSDPLFGRMYTESIDSAYKYLIKKIDVVPGKDNLMIFGVNRYGRYQPQLEHLTCFTGGMLGLGSKLLSREKDFLVAKEVTETCIWAYESSVAGLGPESFTFLPEGSSGNGKEESSERDKETGLPAGISIANPKYIGRPETIESVFYMYRLTGDRKYQDKGWKMFTSWVEHSLTDAGFASIDNVYATTLRQGDSMESFVLAETFKYYYLLFSEPDLISLDDFVFNTEAHPFRIPKHKSSPVAPKPTWKDPGIIFNKAEEKQGTDVQKWSRIQQTAVLARVNF